MTKIIHKILFKQLKKQKVPHYNHGYDSFPLQSLQDAFHPLLKIL